MSRKPIEIDLIISCFITHDRPVNICNRFDLFLATLESYSRITWRNAYFLIELDGEFVCRRQELIDLIEARFSCKTIHIQEKRLVDQKEWQIFLSDKITENVLFWFTQNDDHPYLDQDLEYLIKGFELVAANHDRPASLYFSHWPEILRLSGKVSAPELVDDYVRFEGFLIDAIQVFNTRLMRVIFFETDWRGETYRRIDTILRDAAIWGETEGNIERADQVIFAPLKELCRKFSGYTHVYMDTVPPLKLENGIEHEARSNENIRTLMTAPHQSFWTTDNDFVVPEEWINRSTELYSSSEKLTENPMQRLLSRLSAELRPIAGWFS